MPAKRVVQSTTTSLSKVSGHEIQFGRLVVKPKMLFFAREETILVVMLSGRCWADLLCAFWGDFMGTFLGDFMGTFLGDFAGRFLGSPGAAIVAMQFVMFAHFCVLQGLLSFVLIVPIANLPSNQHHVIFKLNTMIELES